MASSTWHHYLRVRIRGRHRTDTACRIRGRGEKRHKKLSDYWANGMRTMHGIHVHGFPNAFLVQPYGGANLLANQPHNLTDAAKTVAAVMKHIFSRDFDSSRQPRKHRTPG